MRDRGLPCQRPDLEAALVELSPTQLEQVQASAMQLAKGGDARGAMNQLAALRLVSAQASRHALAQAGAIYRADVLLALADAPASAEQFRRALATLRRINAAQSEREQAGAQMQALCGRLDHSDLLHASQPVDAQIEAAQAPETPAPLNAETAPSHARVGEPARRSAPMRAHKVKVYGKAAALTWESAPARQTPAEQAQAALSTVMVEGAKALGDGSFDWASKTVFACTQRELSQLLAVLLGWHESLQFAFHGGKAQKELTLAHQDSGVFVKLRDTGQTVAVPMGDADRYAVAMLVLNVMAGNDPSADCQAVLAVCREVMNPPSFAAAFAGTAQTR